MGLDSHCHGMDGPRSLWSMDSETFSPLIKRAEREKKKTVEAFRCSEASYRTGSLQVLLDLSLADALRIPSLVRQSSSQFDLAASLHPCMQRQKLSILTEAYRAMLMQRIARYRQIYRVLSLFGRAKRATDVGGIGKMMQITKSKMNR